MFFFQEICKNTKKQGELKEKSQKKCNFDGISKIKSFYVVRRFRFSYDY